MRKKRALKAMLNDLLPFLNDTESKQHKILLVEDCKFDTAFLKNIITKCWPQILIDHAETKKQTCTLLKNNKYDAVLLDLNLPDTDSLRDVEEIHKLAKNTPIIIITGMPTEGIGKQVKDYGATGLIEKRFLTRTDFPTVINHAVENLCAA